MIGSLFCAENCARYKIDVDGDVEDSVKLFLFFGGRFNDVIE